MTKTSGSSPGTSNKRSGRTSGLSPTEALALSESPGYRQTFLALEAENDSSIVAAAEEILQVIGRRSPRKAARRTVADGKRCLKVYARD